MNRIQCRLSFALLRELLLCPSTKQNHLDTIQPLSVQLTFNLWNVISTNSLNSMRSGGIAYICPICIKDGWVWWLKDRSFSWPSWQVHKRRGLSLSLISHLRVLIIGFRLGTPMTLPVILFNHWGSGFLRFVEPSRSCKASYQRPRTSLVNMGSRLCATKYCWVVS